MFEQSVGSFCFLRQNSPEILHVRFPKKNRTKIDFKSCPPAGLGILLLNSLIEIEVQFEYVDAGLAEEP
jgi:hypothetical protein